MGKKRAGAGDWVAIILAMGVAISMIILITGVMWSAIKHGQTASSLTENEVQVLIAAFGGIFGILGAYLGFRAGNGKNNVPNFYLRPPTEAGEDTQIIPAPEGWPQPGEH